MKKALFSIAAFTATIFTVSSQTIWDGSTDTDWLGEGTAESPYLISTAEELAGLAERTNKGETFEGSYFLLTSDLWLSGSDSPDDEKPLWEPIGFSQLNNGDSETNPGGFYGKDYYFKGVFDGAGHTIHNLWYAHESEFEDNFNDPFNDGTYDFDGWSKALFGNLEDAVVKNLTVSNVSIQSELRGAGLACTAKNSTITDIVVDGFIQCGASETMGGSAAAIVTEADNCVFERCHSTASVKAVSNAGSMVALLKSSTVKDCTAGGRVGSMRAVGGMVGVLQAGSIVSNCSSSSEVTQFAAKRQGSNVGGFAGTVSGSVIRDCSSTGNLTVDYNGAGFVGTVTDDGLVESCYAVCDIKKDGYGVWMASFVSEIGSGHYVGEDPVFGYVRNCYAAVNYSYEPAPSDIITSGNHIGGFMNTIWDGSQITNCFYNAETATGINTLQPSGEEPHAFEIEFGEKTSYLQSETFVTRLNEMAGVLGTSTWKYEAGNYPVPTGVKATPDLAPFGGGSGTSADPWLISSKENLFKVAEIANHGWNFNNQYLLQTADIALNAPFEEWGEQMPELWTPIGEYFPSGRYFNFTGTYDGGLHKVENLYLDDNVHDFGGMFGVIGDGSHIKNLGVTDAYISFAAEGKAGILVGSAAVWNDDSAGERRISNCWTSGHIQGSDVSAFIGGGSQWGKTIMENCYTTAEITSYSGGGGFFATEVVGEMPVYLISSYFNGTISRYSTGRLPSLFNECVVTNSYFSTDAYPVGGSYEYYKYGRSSEYMKTREFINELSYASAYSDLESPWRYTQDETASFFGQAPEVEVTYEIDNTKSVSFKAFKGSLLTAPVLKAPAENNYLNGWIDSETSGVFNFADVTVSKPLTLTASWSEMVVPDYTPFKNKFSKTYTIKTPAQLLALSYILKGLSPEVEQTDYEGYTILLGNDIEWNDPENFDLWGESWMPMPFVPIGVEHYFFAGTFDGQGHRITGLYLNQPGWSGSFGLFPKLPATAVVKNLILDKAFIEIGFTYDEPWAGILTATNEGTVYRCGADGKIITTGSAQETGSIGGLIGVSSGYSETTLLQECYADVTASLKKQGFGGLIYSTSGNVENCYAKSSVKWSDWYWFGGVACIQQSGTQLHNCWASSEIDWSYTKDLFYNPGGAVYGSNYLGNTGNYYNETSLGEAFGPKSEWEGDRYDPYLFGVGLTDVHMKRMQSFADYDFNEIWGRRNDVNDGYPYLRWTAPGLPNDEDSTLTGVGEISFDGDSIITLYNLQGVKIFSGRKSECNVPAGIYLLRIADNSSKIVVR